LTCTEQKRVAEVVARRLVIVGSDGKFACARPPIIRLDKLESSGNMRFIRRVAFKRI
jgi:hypothetical protein